MTPGLDLTLHFDLTPFVTKIIKVILVLIFSTFQFAFLAYFSSFFRYLPFTSHYSYLVHVYGQSKFISAGTEKGVNQITGEKCPTLVLNRLNLDVYGNFDHLNHNSAVFP